MHFTASDNVVVDDEVNSVDILHCVELVIDQAGNLVEQQRYPGENEHGMVWPSGSPVLRIESPSWFRN